MVKKEVRLAGVVQGQEEIDAVLEVLNRDPVWNVSGPSCAKLQEELAKLYGVKHCVVVNSGSSANLLALAALNLEKDSTVLTSACGFPATLNPILHLDFVPYLVDYDIKTLNISLSEIEYVLENHEIDAVLIAHTLGSSLDMDILMYLKNKYKFILIEDCCESLGTMYNGKMVGTFGEIGTISFYSSHQISGFGGGGALLTNDDNIYARAKSLRDWGKENVREGQINTQFSTSVDGVAYDQQYTYKTIGYNMRYPDANCAYALAQLKRLPEFINKREQNYLYLHDTLADLPLDQMQWPDISRPAFFGYPIVLKPNNEGLRDKLVNYLETNGVHTRLFFAGNILRHDAYKDIYYIPKTRTFPIADYLMENAFFVGVWPGLTLDDMEYISTKIHKFFQGS